MKTLKWNLSVLVSNFVKSISQKTAVVPDWILSDRENVQYWCTYAHLDRLSKNQKANIHRMHLFEWGRLCSPTRSFQFIIYKKHF